MINFFRIAFFIAASTFAFVLLLGCDKSLETSGTKFKEIQRTSSPDQRVEVVFIERATDATVGSVHEVHVVPNGKSISTTTLILRADKVQEMKARWTTSKSLSIEYQNARIFQFTNFWQNKEVDNFSYTVDIRLTPVLRPLSVEIRE